MRLLRLRTIIPIFIITAPVLLFCVNYIMQLHYHNINQQKAVLAELDKALFYIKKQLTDKCHDFVKSKIICAKDILRRNKMPCQSKTLLPDQPLYACPERFRHAEYGHPLFMNMKNGSWVVEECSPTYKKPISEILSIVLIPQNDAPCSQHTRKLVQQIRDLYPKISILLHMHENDENNECFPEEMQTVQKIKTARSPLGQQLNELVSFATTPLVLIGRNLDYFDRFARLERQLSMFSTKNPIHVVGGSVRNESGHYQVGCYQTNLKYYTLEYIDGYYASRNECMFCDHLLGPFIADKRIFNDTKFDVNLTADVVFEDFYLRLKNSRKTVINCPDVMYEASDPGIRRRLEIRTTWKPIVLKYQLNRIVLPNGDILKFSCAESLLSCEKLYLTDGSKMMPICCRDAILNAYNIMHRFAVEKNIGYEIDGGSALGAVKLGDVLPWDLDVDGSIHTHKKEHFTKEMNWSNSKGNVFVDNIHQNTTKYALTFCISVEKFCLEFCTKDKLSADVKGVPGRFRSKPTLIRIGDVWVYAPASPGLYSRNYYGKEMLKHANSYYQLGGGRYWYSPYDTSKRFLKCKKKHHACLNQFTEDGNIQFIKYLN